MNFADRAKKLGTRSRRCPTEPSTAFRCGTTGTPWLWDEFLASSSRYAGEIHARLREIGVTEEHERKAGGVRFSEIAVSGQMYQPTEPGFGWDVVVVPVHTWCTRSPASVIDLVAFTLDHPERCWLRRGVATLLGHEALETFWFDTPLHVFRTPLSWLRAACDGVVILDWGAAIRELPIGSRELVAEDLEHGRELKRRLTVSAIEPRVRVPRRQHAAA